MTQRGECQFVRESAPSPSSGQRSPEAEITTKNDELRRSEHRKEKVQNSGNQTITCEPEFSQHERPPPSQTRARDQFLIRQLSQLNQLYEKREEVLKYQCMRSERQERRQRNYYKQKLKEHCLRHTRQENQLQFQLEQALQRESALRKDLFYMLESSRQEASRIN